MEKLRLLNISTPVLAAVLLLTIMASILLVGAAKWTTTTDESPHIVSGYSYLENKDYRLNPEHPPLIKMMAGAPLLFRDLNFPYDHQGWTDGITEDAGQWGQWGLGDAFLHQAGNDPVDVTFWSRTGIIVITILLGVLLFVWTRKLYGAIAALFALFLFVFSPNFLAHGALVTTDVGAAFAFLLAAFYLFKYLKNQTTKNLILAGVAFGIANLMKFSLVLIIPHFFLVAVAWVFFKDKPKGTWKTTKRVLLYSGKLILIGIIALAIIYPFYLYSTWNYPPELQQKETELLLRGHNFPALADGVTWMADKPYIRAMGHFFLGHLMVFQRVSGGNTTYYFGDVSNVAWASYFPVVFGLKVPVALLIMFLIGAGMVWIVGYRKTKVVLKSWPALKDKTKHLGKLLYKWGQEYFIEWALMLFVVIYWTSSVLGNLNLGFRHVLPTLPFLYIILAGIFHRWIHKNSDVKDLNWMRQLQVALRSFFGKWVKSAVVAVLLIWYMGSSLAVFPHYLAYFNELAGGPDNGHNYVVDSNLDWGQDLRGLSTYVEQNNIETIKLDYFGGGNPSYYLGDKYERFDPFGPEENRTGWIAISVTPLQNGNGVATKGFTGSTDHYSWLNDHEIVDKIGYSIFVYHIE